MKSILKIVFMFSAAASFAKTGQTEQTMSALLKKVSEESKNVKTINLSNTKKKETLPPSTGTAPASQKAKSKISEFGDSKQFITTNQEKDQKTYESALDSQIIELTQLTKRFKNDPRRAEIWLRLAEAYIEKIGLLKEDLVSAEGSAAEKAKKEQTIKDQIYKLQDSSIKLYEAFIKDFPDHPKMDQALFYLGYQYTETSQKPSAVTTYRTLVDQHPNSRYAADGSFLLAETYSDQEIWKEAIKYYQKVLTEKKNTYYYLALYKSAWAHYKTNDFAQAVKYFEELLSVPSESRASTNDNVTQVVVNNLQIQNEVKEELIVFLSELPDVPNSIKILEKYFKDSAKISSLEKFGQYTLVKGYNEKSRVIYQYLVDLDKNAKNAFMYQEKIVLTYSNNKETVAFEKALQEWVDKFGEKSEWQAANKGDLALIAAASQSLENNVRALILQKHSMYQKNPTENLQKNLLELYSNYLKSFSKGQYVDEMHFYYAELLYDLKKYPEASQEYKTIAESYPSSRFNEKAYKNSMISLEKALPTEQEISDSKASAETQKSNQARINQFGIGVKWYLDRFPKSENSVGLQFKVARLKYLSNQLDDAKNLFEEIIVYNPKSQEAVYSANLILDIYNIRKDYPGLVKYAEKLLTMEAFAKGKSGDEIKKILYTSRFQVAKSLETQEGSAGDAISQYKQIISSSSDPELVFKAYYNLGINYEKLGDRPKAIEAYETLLKLEPRDSNEKALQFKVQGFLANIYRESSHLDKAAKLYKILSEHPLAGNDAADFLFNYALMKEFLGETNEAVDYFNKYLQKTSQVKEKEVIALKSAKLYTSLNRISEAKDLYTAVVKGSEYSSVGKLQAEFGLYNLKKMTMQLPDATAFMKRYDSLPEAEKKNFAREYSIILYDQAFSSYKSMLEVKFSDPSKNQKKQVELKLEKLTKLNEALAKIVKVGSPEELVNSFILLGNANLAVADEFKGAPIPADLPEESKQQYTEEISKIAKPFEDKAYDSFVLASEKARALTAYTEYYLENYNLMIQKWPKKFSIYKPALKVTTRTADLTNLLIDERASLYNPELLAAIRSKDEKKVEAVCFDILVKNPNHFAAHLMLFNIYFERKWFMADSFLKKAAALRPNHYMVSYSKGLALQEKSASLAALQEYKKSYEENRNFEPTKNNLLVHYFKMNDAASACDIIKTMGTSDELAKKLEIGLLLQCKIGPTKQASN